MWKLLVYKIYNYSIFYKMNRLFRYKESLVRFIKDKNTNSIIDIFNFDNIISIIENSDITFPIILLTTMNNQNKRHKLSMQGYYTATTIELLSVIISLHENNSLDTIKYNNLIANCGKGLEYNIESIKTVVESDKLVNIMQYSLQSYNNFIKDMDNLFDFKVEFANSKHCNDVIKWYLKDNNELIDKYKQTKLITKESLEKYIYYRYTKLCELSILLGWIMGGGSNDNILKLKKTAKYFSILYKLSIDFQNLENDISNNNNYNYNYILNCGLQNSYESFLIYKEKFIEESMIQDIYTNTFKELLDNIEEKIDFVIDKSSPDLKSNFTITPNSIQKK